ncbi:SGNH/GDSL hydrolase family protein, partial [Ramlibacter aquaticus]
APVPPPAPTPAPQAAVLSPDIACWGDSLTPPFAANLQLLVGAREVYNGGVVGETSTQIAARETADTDHRDWISIFWYGANNPTEPDQVKADIAASIAALAPGNDRFYVLSVVNVANTDGEPGGIAYADILQLNQDLAKLYPDNYYDIRSYLVSQYNPALPQDVLDHQMDLVPSSLRFDIIHLNNDGSVLVAQKVKELLDAKGW